MLKSVLSTINHTQNAPAKKRRYEMKCRWESIPSFIFGDCFHDTVLELEKQIGLISVQISNDQEIYYL